MNLLRFTFERSPLAPIVGQFRADVLAGGARRDVALARMAVGSSIAALFADWAYEGHVQGVLPRDRGVKEAILRQGLQPDSIRFGEHTFRINRIDPLGMQLSVAASMANLVKAYQTEEEDLGSLTEIAAAFATAVSDSVLNKTWFTGVSMLVSAMQDPERRGPRYIQSVLSSLLPFSSALRVARGLEQPELPEFNDTGEAIQSMIVGLQDRLPRRRTLWGDPIVVDRINLLSPARVEKIESQPIDREIVANRANIERIPRKTTFQGAEVDFTGFPHVYETYVQLAGNDLKLINGKGARDYLNSLVDRSYYQSLSKGPDGERVRRIRKTIRQYREAAQDEIFFDLHRKYQDPEFQEFREVIRQRQQRNIDLRIPRPIGAQQ